MAINPIVILLSIIVLIALIAGIIFLQVYLSKAESKWLGLILPVVFFMISLLAVFSITAFTSMSTQMHTVTENGKVINEVIEKTTNEPLMDRGSLIGTVIVTLFLYNIPTVILLLIYAACREKNKRNKHLDKMKVQDLE